MSSKPCIDLLKGSPATALLPTQRLSDAAVSALSKPEVAATGLDYGPDEGHFPLRTHLAEWLTGYYKPSQPIQADRICVTGGASQNLANILQVFTDPSQTRYIWMAQATYHLAFRIFEDAGFYRRLRAVPEDEEGMDMGFLEHALANDEAVAERAEGYKRPERYRKIYSHVIYCVPNFSNPTGVTMSIRRREVLVRLARKFNALVICDDVYDFLHWSAANSPDNGNPWRSTLPRVLDLDRTLDGGPRDSFGNVVSNGTFSKIVAPGCRVGWAEGEPQLVYGLSQVGSTVSGGPPSQLMSTFIDEMLQDGSLTKHIREVLIPAYSHRHFIMVSAVKERLSPLGVGIHTDASDALHAGGFFVWIRLPQPLTACNVTERALQDENLIVGNGDIFIVPGNQSSLFHDQCLRLCFAWEDEADLTEGVRRLEKVLVRMLNEVKS
ncbi:hypothetical protein CNMCM8980_009347 [Aspergillus fumigatiaffinis]|uniref:Aminotransferase class I/classII large domain-containing protein n=1 Tax=Aspergillus fumigatiaffinis TaxID=340414 RepID=A0A8H4H1F8_9EURO|nr:hypothetical protein CNMCM5878_003032 [Aspergillus fumigatiaffinis]KAF4224200.1 hypothetical protein CNMCM6457_009625 [Aspergillus fumigatiaffinis]KAF4232669.1 hypothetical protein CNMCM6805_009692 [Aspergillus fumigatiaffinis]KAF4245763.1 hypothetical protein CNMCM8980_009347 [Aspergillus fumigatiaffinis]